MNTVTFTITERIGVVKENSNGWVKELNMVSWNEGKPKCDIRGWDATHEHMTRGITLTEEEMDTIVSLWTGRKEV